MVLNNDIGAVNFAVVYIIIVILIWRLFMHRKSRRKQ